MSSPLSKSQAARRQKWLRVFLAGAVHEKCTAHIASLYTNHHSTEGVAECPAAWRIVPPPGLEEELSENQDYTAPQSDILAGFEGSETQAGPSSPVIASLGVPDTSTPGDFQVALDSIQEKAQELEDILENATISTAPSGPRRRTGILRRADYEDRADYYGFDFSSKKWQHVDEELFENQAAVLHLAYVDTARAKAEKVVQLAILRHYLEHPDVPFVTRACADHLDVCHFLAISAVDPSAWLDQCVAKYFQDLDALDPPDLAAKFVAISDELGWDVDLEWLQRAIDDIDCKD